MRENDNRAYRIDHDEESTVDEARGQVVEGAFGSGGDPRLTAEAEKAFGANSDVAGLSAEQAAPPAGALVRAVIGGILASIAGGAAWAAVVILSGYEIGYAAIGVGALSGTAVVFLSGGGRGTTFQALAVLSSVLGVAVGKYGGYFYFLKEAVGEEYGMETAATVKIFSPGVLKAFMMDAGSILGGYDILWVILAVITAWKIPSLKTPEVE